MSEQSNDLIYIQANLFVPKSRKNEFGGFNYRNCEDIVNAVKPLLDERGCEFTMTDEVLVLGEGEAARFYFKATARFKDSAGAVTEVTGYAREPVTRKGMDESQISGSASSYARKYAASGMFLLDDSTDPDEVVDITEADVAYFQDLVENEDRVTLCAMQIEDYGKYQVLRRESAPKGGKTKFIEQVNALVLEAVEWAREAANRIIELADKEDGLGIKEEVQDMTREQKVIIWRQIPEAKHIEIKRLMS